MKMMTRANSHLMLIFTLSLCCLHCDDETLSETSQADEETADRAPEDSPAFVVDASPGEVAEQELRILRQETPRDLRLEWIYREFGYQQFPSEIFARKGGSGESMAHEFLNRLGQQIYQQALLAHLDGDTAYADNALMLLKATVSANLRYKNDPNNSSETNDNRFLESGWFLNFLVRGARILDLMMPQKWKQQNGWGNFKGWDLNRWLGWSVDQDWKIGEALNKKILDLTAHAGTMNWVGRIDTRYGATNRTFAMIEAQMRVAELRGGAIGKYTVNPAEWQKGCVLEQQGSIGDLFEIFRGYLAYYFNKPLSKDPKEFKLNYAPDKSWVNSNPNLLNIEDCRDPSNLGFKAKCLINKDAFRNDTYHPLMGLASILHIMDIAERWGYSLTEEEEEKVIMGLRWAAFNNTPGVTWKWGSSGIQVWELAFRFFDEEDLGPYCKRDLENNRSNDKNKKAGLAWGYVVIAEGF